MTTCPQCSKELSDETKFCDSCGAQIFETIFCSNCGAQTSTEFAFCQNCGASVAETPAAEQPAAEQLPTEAAGKKKASRKAILFGGIGAAVVAVLIGVFFLFFSGGKGENIYALYVKEDEIFFNDLKKNSESWQVTSRLVAAEGIDNETLAYRNSTLGFCSYMSEDGKYLFFPDKLSYDDGFTLYYKKVSDPEAKAIKIDSDVRYYAVNTSASIVTYQKHGEGDLYQYKIKEDSKDKVAGDVDEFYVSDDGTKICYLNSESNLYLNVNGEKEKLAGDVYNVYYVTEDFSTVYYLKDDCLYKQTEGADKEKIASNVRGVLRIYDSGEIYYVTEDTETHKMADYVTDDMKAADALISYPAYPTYPKAPSSPYRWDYDTYSEYSNALAIYRANYAAWQDTCDRLDEEYYDAVEAYWDKDSRDDLREDLKEETLEITNLSLCFYDGTEETVLTDTYDSGTSASDAPVIVFSAYDPSHIEKVKLSEIDDIYDVEDMVEEALYTSSEFYIAVKDSATLIEQENTATAFRINTSGTIVYYLDNISDKAETGDLYRISISNGTAGTPEVYDSDVYIYGLYGFVSDGEFAYLKEYDSGDGVGDLYINGKKIDHEVLTYSLTRNPDLGIICYFTDFDPEKKCGTLNLYNGKEAVEIDNDVYSCSITPGGRVLYLYDYSLKNYEGELREWSNGETRKIDDDVVCLLPIYDYKMRGSFYGW
ncbi:MAG: hypothetical protein E7443_05230 [Ruminococcaceae bacterium]|nr:hypothetical protein [Oscillospiraceae bacterium]